MSYLSGSPDVSENPIDRETMVEGPIVEVGLKAEKLLERWKNKTGEFDGMKEEDKYNDSGLMARLQDAEKAVKEWNDLKAKDAEVVKAVHPEDTSKAA